MMNELSVRMIGDQLHASNKHLVNVGIWVRYHKTHLKVFANIRNLFLGILRDEGASWR
jgi:hypothetical protein